MVKLMFYFSSIRHNHKKGEKQVLTLLLVCLSSGAKIVVKILPDKTIDAINTSTKINVTEAFKILSRENDGGVQTNPRTIRTAG